MFYIRFTNDIQRDFKVGKSKDFKSGAELAGLCAWKINADLHEYSDESEIIEAAKKTAQNVRRGSYGGYSSGNQFAVLMADYIGSSNDGSIVKVKKIISIESL
jgi:hypothetical protein